MEINRIYLLKTVIKIVVNDQAAPHGKSGIPGKFREFRNSKFPEFRTGP
jgi:hypothetical protein